MAQLGGTPVLILKEGSERTRGRDAQSRNILANRIFFMVQILFKIKKTGEPLRILQGYIITFSSI